MPSQTPFRKDGLWLRGNIHTHSANNGGSLTAEGIGHEYGKRGYDFVFLTDQHICTPAPKEFAAHAPGRPLLVGAEEIVFQAAGAMFHAVCLGQKDQWQGSEFRDLSEAIERADNEGISLVMSHPYWLRLRSEVFINARPFLGVEIYNHLCDAVGKGYGTVQWDEMLDAGLRVFGFACDDFLNFDCSIAGGWIMVKAAVCTEDAILEAMRSGDFYSTQGPEIHDFSIEEGKVRVACSPVTRVNFISNRSRGGVLRAPENSQVTDATWDVDFSGVQSGYVRVECIDTQGRIAWSNPIWLP